MYGECINCGGVAGGQFYVRVDADETIDASLCEPCVAELNSESFISVVRRVSFTDHNR